MENPTIISLSTEPILFDKVFKAITLPTTGASVMFVGIVRGITDLQSEQYQTVELEYEAYQEMAMAKILQIVEEMRTRWVNIEGIAIQQRVGKILAGSPTTLIACTAAHRDTGVFEAAKYGIDRLKEIVPIWKKEIGPSGEVWVNGEYHPKPGE